MEVVTSISTAFVLLQEVHKEHYEQQRFVWFTTADEREEEVRVCARARVRVSALPIKSVEFQIVQTDKFGVLSSSHI